MTYLFVGIDEISKERKLLQLKKEIFKEQGVVKGTKKQLQTVVGYLEIWFTYYVPAYC